MTDAHGNAPLFNISTSAKTPVASNMGDVFFQENFLTMRQKTTLSTALIGLFNLKDSEIRKVPTLVGI